MKLNIIFNSEDKSLSVSRDGVDITSNLSHLEFFSQNGSNTKFSVDMTEVTLKEPDEDGFKSIDIVTRTSAETKKAFAQAIMDDNDV